MISVDFTRKKYSDNFSSIIVARFFYSNGMNNIFPLEITIFIHTRRDTFVMLRTINNVADDRREIFILSSTCIPRHSIVIFLTGLYSPTYSNHSSIVLCILKHPSSSQILLSIHGCQIRQEQKFTNLRARQ